MKLCVIGKGEAVMTDVPVPAPGRREVLIEMRACGICGTDFEKLAGNYSSTVLGHEAVGIVEEAGRDIDAVSSGDRVFPHHHVPCYNCHYCRSGSETMCPEFSKANLRPGGLAEYFILPEWNISHGGLFVLPSAVSFRTGTLIEPLACVLRGLRKLAVGKDSTVAVVGSGPVGMLQLFALKALGVRNVVAMDVSEERSRFARTLGAVSSFTSASGLKEACLSLSDGRGADASIVATGHPAATEAGIASLRKGGIMLQFGLPHPGTALVHDTSDLFRKEIQILNTYSGVERDVSDAIEMLTSHGAKAEDIISHSFRLERAPDAFRTASDAGNVRKVIVENGKA